MNQKSLLVDLYKELDKKFNHLLDYSYEYLVNFSQTKELPIHRWYYYVEGYSPLLVRKVFEMLNLKNNSIVFDPFSGSGTTLLTSKELGMDSIGFEINPFSAFMAKVKTRDYPFEILEEFKKFNIGSISYTNDVYNKYELKIIQNLFDREKLEKIEVIKNQINSITHEKTRDLLYMALLSIIPTVSNYRKGGNGLKKKRIIKDVDPIEEFNKSLKIVYQDISTQNQSIFGKEPIIYNESCLNLENFDIPDIDISLFSPPYANCFDPFEVYKTELWIGEFVNGYGDLREKRKKALSSNLNANINKDIDETHRTDTLTSVLSFLQEQKLWNNKIPKMLDTYFYEMYHVLKKIYHQTVTNGFCVIVVGNSAYGQIAIPTDLLLTEIGEKVGFRSMKIIEARRNETSSQQHLKLENHIDYIRESIIVLQK